jgi:hypothetical protein
VLWGGLALGVTVLVTAFVLVGPGRRLARSGPVVQVAQAASIASIKDWDKAVEQMDTAQAASTSPRSDSASPEVAAPSPRSDSASPEAAAPNQPHVSSSAPPKTQTSSRNVVRPAPSSGVPGKKTGAPGGGQGAAPPTRSEQKKSAVELEWML